MISWSGGGTPATGTGGTFVTKWDTTGVKTVKACCSGACATCFETKDVKVIGGDIKSLDSCGGDIGKLLLLNNPASNSPTDQYERKSGQPTGTTYKWDISAGATNAHIVGSDEQYFVNLQADNEGDFTLRLTYTNGNVECTATLQSSVQKPSQANSGFSCGSDYNGICTLSPPLYRIMRDVLYYVRDGSGRAIPHALWDETWTGSALPVGGWDGYTLCDGTALDHFSWYENVACDGSSTAYKQDVQTIKVAGWPSSGNFWGPWTVEWRFNPHIYHSGCGN